ncbi:MAG: hypothetical protein SFY81_02780 [Verrucomicrobiota bacterium]|nr:hypothetical protein [Verrucomicrobiota bacterium]
MLKRNGKPIRADAAPENGAADAPREFKENDVINGQIDGYIKDNPKYWETIKAMPRERLERHVIYQQLRFNARKEKLDNGVLRRVEENPALKDVFDKLIEQLPENQREQARVNIARNIVFSEARSQRQTAKNAVAV